MKKLRKEIGSIRQKMEMDTFEFPSKKNDLQTVRKKHKHHE